MFLARVSVLLLLHFVVSGEAAWRFANPKPHGNNIIEMFLRNDVIWQVGDRGSLHTSADLDNWVTHETGTRNSLRGITSFKGQIYICGEAGLILYGTNAASLSSRSLNTTNWLEAIAASTNALVAVGDNGSIYYSPDGQSWTRKGNATAWLRGVDYGQGQFVAVGEGGFIATSADGQSWVQRNGPNVDLNRVAFIDNRFWVVGDKGTVLTNTFRFDFNTVNIGGITNDLFAVAGNSNDIVVAGDLTVRLGKPNGGPWIEQTDVTNVTLAPVWPYFSAIWDGRLFLLGGRTGMKVEGYRTNSTGPILWFSEPQPARSWLWSATRGTDFYAAVGAETTIVTSLDGFNWNREVVPQNTQGEILLGVGGNTNALVAVGSAGVLLTSPNIVTNSVSTNENGQLETNLVSLMGVIWNKGNSGTINDLQGVAANNSAYVVTGAKGTILYSVDATTWLKSISGISSYLSGAAASPNGFIVCGDLGVILASSDGLLWTSRNSKVTAWIYTVRYLNGKFVAVGEGGLILTSDDGVQWTQRTSGITEWINDVTYAQGNWIAVTSGGWLITSANTINWTATKSITSRSLYSVVTDGSQLVAVGLEGAILRNQLVSAQSPVNFISFGLVAGESHFLFGGVPGQSFSLESSQNVAGGWQPEVSLEINDPGGTLIYERVNASESARFFRTKLLSP